jgi:hypothetical protein
VYWTSPADVSAAGMTDALPEDMRREYMRGTAAEREVMLKAWVRGN